VSRGTALQRQGASNGRTDMIRQAKAAHLSKLNAVKVEDNSAANLDALAVPCACTNLAWLNSFACLIRCKFQAELIA